MAGSAGRATDVIALLAAIVIAQQIVVPAPPTPQPLLPSVQASPDRCDAPATLSVPALPAYPASTHAIRTPLNVEVRVELDDKGAVTGAEIEKSSGRDDVDTAALAAARASTYAPAQQHCTPVASHYTFMTRFAPPSLRRR